MSAPFSFPDLKPLKLRTDNDDQSTISGELAKVESVVERLANRFIVITAAEGYDFPSGSAELTDALNKYIRNKLLKNIEENIQKYDVNTVVVIGHTDGQPVADPFSNLDGLVEEVASGNKSIKELQEGSNTDLGLMRALAVVRKLQDIQKSEGRLKSLDPLKGFRAYSSGPLTLRNGEFAQPNKNPDQQRRRIEIRFTNSE